MKDNKSKERLIELLFKKAEGFHFVEEQFEYEKPKTKPNNNQKFENLNFFDLCDRGDGISNDESDKIRVTNEGQKYEGSQNLILVKKKVTSKYIPPDMFAIKILLEIFGKEGLDEIEKLTDEELIKFKEKLIEEIKNEDRNEN